MTSYISQIELTEEKYIEMVSNPIVKEARKKWKKWKTLKMIGIVISGVMSAACIIGKDYDFAIFAGVFAIVFAYQLFIQRKQMIRKAYHQSLRSMNADRWIRTITFDDKITVSDGNSSSVFEYLDCRQVTENDKDYLLYINENIVIRVEKGSFIHGEEEKFLLWIKNKIS